MKRHGASPRWAEGPGVNKGSTAKSLADLVLPRAHVPFWRGIRGVAE